MNILVTGATGFIGRHLYNSLSKTDNLFILTRKGSDVSCLPDARTFEFCDDVESLQRFLSENRIDGIIHLASLYIAQHTPDDIKNIILSNIYLGTALLDAATKAGVKWFLNIGSIWQNYNSPSFSDEYHPVNLYAASKQAFMTMAKFYTETSDIRFSTLKLCDTYGEGDTRRKIVDLFGRIALSGETLDMSPGEQLLDIVHVDKVIESIVRLMNKLNDKSQPVRDEYVVTSGRRISLRDFAAEYERKNGVKLNINWGGRPYRPREVMNPYVGTPVD